MRDLLWASLLACLVACDKGNDLDEQPDAGDERRRPPVALPLEDYTEASAADLAVAASGVRFIAVTERREGDAFSCILDGVRQIQRRNGQFRIVGLFEDDLPEGVPPTDLPDALRRFCLVEWVPEVAGRLPAQADLEAARRHLARFVEFSEDLQVGAPQDAALSEASRAPLTNAWRAHLGQLRPLPEPRADQALTPIRIAVADTSPRSATGEPMVGRSEHGLTMGRIAQVFSCPAGGPCPGYVTHHLALPRLSASERSAEGGFYGYQGEIARAIAEAILMWSRADGSTGSRHLVLNLSLGWDARYGGPITTSPEADLRPAARAVYEALTFAACRGVLAVAAAGNRAGGPDEVPGPLYPAGWEALPAPDDAQCLARFGIDATLPGAGAYRPLLYAVGGVRPDDRDLGIRRAGSRPRLVASAFQANVGFDEGNGLASTGVHTGTSVAAAATSGIAAGLWAYRPMLDRHALMQALYDGGVPLGQVGEPPVTAELCLGGGCSVHRVHRLDMCGAYALLCGAGEEACDGDTVPDCTPLGSHAGDLRGIEPAEADLAAAAAARTTTTLDAAAFDSEAAPPAGCDYVAGATTPRVGTSAPLAAGCPADQFYLRQTAPWAAPQPWGNLCPTCYGIADLAKVKVTLTLYTSAEYVAHTFTNGLVSFKNVSGKYLSGVPLADLGVTSFKGGDVIKLSGVTLPPGTVSIALETLGSTDGKVSATLDELAWW